MEVSPGATPREPAPAAQSTRVPADGDSEVNSAVMANRLTASDESREQQAGRQAGATSDEHGLLPPGWKTKIDPKKNRRFYYNREKDVTSWHRPEPDDYMQNSNTRDLQAEQIAMLRSRIDRVLTQKEARRRSEEAGKEGCDRAGKDARKSRPQTPPDRSTRQRLQSPSPPSKAAGKDARKSTPQTPPDRRTRQRPQSPKLRRPSAKEEAEPALWVAAAMDAEQAAKDAKAKQTRETAEAKVEARKHRVRKMVCFGIVVGIAAPLAVIFWETWGKWVAVVMGVCVACACFAGVCVIVCRYCFEFILINIPWMGHNSSRGRGIQWPQPREWL